MNLLPCPFCGSKVHCNEVIIEDQWGERYGYFAIECGKCNNQQYATVLSGVHGDEESDTIKAWNTRADYWRPIEEAPKDGTMHIRWSELHGFVVANQPPQHGAGVWELRGGKWFGAAMFEAAEATHFMPLPNPPKK